MTIDKLKQKIKSRFPQAQFEKGISGPEITRFEKEHKIKLSDDLILFYQWHNGITIHENLQIPSLQDAFRFFEGIRHIQYTINPEKKREKEDKLSSEKDVQNYLKSIENPTIELTGLWLPILMVKGNYRQSSYALRITHPIKSHKDEQFIAIAPFLIQKKSDGIAFEYFQYDSNALFIMYSLADIIRILTNHMTPQEKDFWTELKEFLQDAKSMLDSL